MHKIRKMRTKHTQAIRRGDTTRVRRRTLTHCTHHTHSHTISPQQLCVLHWNTQTTNDRRFKRPPGEVVTFVWKGEVLQWSQQQNKTTFGSLSPPPPPPPRLQHLIIKPLIYYHHPPSLPSPLTSSSAVIIIILIIIVILSVIITTAATV